MAHHSTSRIGVFLDVHPPSFSSFFGPHISRLTELGTTLSITSTIAELEIWLRERKLDVLVLFHGKRLGPELEACLQRSRNFSHARPVRICSIAQSLSIEDLNHLGRLGVLRIYLEPIRSNVWLDAVRDLLSPVASVPTRAHLREIDPVGVTASAFGRIGKLHLAPPGALSVETSLKAKPGDLIDIQGPLQRHLPDVRAKYAVIETTTHNLYYRYENRLEIDPVFKLTAAHWQDWIKDQQEWVVPKTKLLWVTSEYSPSHEALFDKSLFSVYIETAAQLNLESLDRISPRIILIEEVGGDTVNLIESWQKNNADDPRLVVTSLLRAPKEWKTLHCFLDHRLSPELELTLRQFLKKRILTAARKSKFVARTSELSRIHFPFPAVLNGISLEHFSLISPFDLQIPSPLRIQLTDPKIGDPSAHFGRTVHSEFLAGHQAYRLFCEWVPRSDNMELVLKNFRELLR